MVGTDGADKEVIEIQENEFWISINYLLVRGPHQSLKACRTHRTVIHFWWVLDAFKGESP